MKRRWFVLLVSLALVVGVIGVAPVGVTRAAPTAGITYYSQGSLAPNLTTSWNTVRGGGGSAPANFTGGDIFVVQSGHSMTTSATWTVSGTGAKIQIEGGGTLQANNAVTVPTFQIDAGGKFIHNTGTATVPGTARSFAANSTYEIWNQGTASISAGVTWGNVIINLASDPGQAIGNAGAFATVGGSFTVQNTRGREYRFTAAQTTQHNIAGNLTVQNGGMLNFKSGANAITINIGGNVSIESGGVLTLTTSGAVNANVSGNWTNSGALTAGTSTVSFNGTSTQAIGGTSATTFNNLTVNSGAQVVFPTNVGATILTNNGTITQIQDVNGNSLINFIGIGGYGGVTLNANSLDLGSTTVIIKGNQACNTGGELAKRCFNITPANTTGRSATITFFYGSGELNGNTCAAMTVYHWNGSTWDALSSSGQSCSGSLYSVTATGVTTFSPFGLSSATPTAITLTTFSGRTPTNNGWIVLILLAVVMLLMGGWALRRRSRL